MRDTRFRAIFSDLSKRAIFTVYFAATFSTALQTVLAQPQQPTCISASDATQDPLNAATAYQLLKSLIDSIPQNKQTIAFDEGTHFGFVEAAKKYETMTDEDKDRLGLPDNIEAFRKGDYGTFAVGGRLFEISNSRNGNCSDIVFFA